MGEDSFKRAESHNPFANTPNLDYDSEIAVAATIIRNLRPWKDVKKGVQQKVRDIYDSIGEKLYPAEWKAATEKRNEGESQTGKEAEKDKGKDEKKSKKNTKGKKINDDDEEVTAERGARGESDDADSAPQPSAGKEKVVSLYTETYTKRIFESCGFGIEASNDRYYKNLEQFDVNSQITAWNMSSSWNESLGGLRKSAKEDLYYAPNNNLSRLILTNRSLVQLLAHHSSASAHKGWDENLYCPHHIFMVIGEPGFGMLKLIMQAVMLGTYSVSKLETITLLISSPSIRKIYIANLKKIGFEGIMSFETEYGKGDEREVNKSLL